MAESRRHVSRSRENYTRRRQFLISFRLRPDCDRSPDTHSLTNEPQLCFNCAVSTISRLYIPCSLPTPAQRGNHGHGSCHRRAPTHTHTHTHTRSRRVLKRDLIMQRFAFCSSSRGEKLSGHFLRVAFSFLSSFSFFFFFLVFWFSSSLRPFLSENYTHTEVKRGNVLQKIKSLLAHANRSDLRSFQNRREGSFDFLCFCDVFRHLGVSNVAANLRGSSLTSISISISLFDRQPS